jgi:hypothetical protein
MRRRFSAVLGIFASLVPQFCIAHFYCAHLITYNFIHYTYSFKKNHFMTILCNFKTSLVTIYICRKFYISLTQEIFIFGICCQEEKYNHIKSSICPYTVGFDCIHLIYWFLSHAWFCIYVIEGKAVLWFKFT